MLALAGQHKCQSGRQRWIVICSFILATNQESLRVCLATRQSALLSNFTKIFSKQPSTLSRAYWSASQAPRVIHAARVRFWHGALSGTPLIFVSTPTREASDVDSWALGVGFAVKPCQVAIQDPPYLNGEVHVAFRACATDRTSRPYILVRAPSSCILTYLGSTAHLSMSIAPAK